MLPLPLPQNLHASFTRRLTNYTVVNVSERFAKIVFLPAWKKESYTSVTTDSQNLHG